MWKALERKLYATYVQTKNITACVSNALVQDSTRPLHCTSQATPPFTLTSTNTCLAYRGEAIAVPQQLEAARVRAQVDVFEATVTMFRTAFLQVAPFNPPLPVGDDISMAQVCW